MFMKSIRIFFLLALLFPVVALAQVVIPDIDHPAGWTDPRPTPPGTVYVPGSVPVIPDLDYGPTTGAHVEQPTTPPVTPGTPTIAVKLDTHLLVDEQGVGDQCKAGETLPTEWNLGADPVNTKEKIVDVIQNAALNDLRLRSVYILDGKIDMYYLQPAKKWGFVPTNYYLHVSASGDTFRISLEKPKWLGKAKSQHAFATEAFSTYVPQYLDAATVETLSKKELIERDAKMVEVISRVMYQVKVQPISNSFFVCYIMPFLIYILVIIVLVSVGLWFLIRRMKRGTGFLVKKIHPVVLGEDNFEAEYTGDKHVTHFKLPKQ